MKNHLCPLLAGSTILLAAISANAQVIDEPGRPATSIWAAEYPYGEATAADPHFDDERVWPHLTGKEYFLDTQWDEPKRTLAWAQPGTTGGRNGPLDPYDPANWVNVETGEPAQSLPDRDTDVIIPASDESYEVNWRFAGHGNPEWGPPLEARHVTVGSNVHFAIVDGEIYGNVWVQREGHFNVDVTMNLLGSKHTFYRNDNTGGSPSAVGSRDKSYLCQYLMFNKAEPDASAEFLGMFHSGDEFQVVSGTMIVGPDTVVEMGREGSPYIEKDGRIVLLDNAYLGKWSIDFHVTDLDLRGGTLQAGLPDRPLARDAIVRVSHKNHTAAQYSEPVSDEDGEIEMAAERHFRRVPGILLQEGSTLRTYSTDIDQARLVITALPAEYPITFLRPALGSRAYEDRAENPLRGAFMQWLTELPQGIDIAVRENVTVEGVEFDGLRAQGLMVQNREAVDQWEKVFWGENNLAPQEELIADLPEELEDGGEY
ncbi:MAG: hypothetical protein WD534_02640 [Phycisphaeraceae bacterium]